LVRVDASYAASPVLAKQIEAGAPADAFFSADRAWVDYLEERGLRKRGSRWDVLGSADVLRRTQHAASAVPVCCTSVAMQVGHGFPRRP